MYVGIEDEEMQSCLKHCHVHLIDKVRIEEEKLTGTDFRSTFNKDFWRRFLQPNSTRRSPKSRLEPIRCREQRGMNFRTTSVVCVFHRSGILNCR